LARSEFANCQSLLEDIDRSIVAAGSWIAENMYGEVVLVEMKPKERVYGRVSVGLFLLREVEGLSWLSLEGTLISRSVFASR